MSDQYYEPAKETVTELKIQKSRFIAHVLLAENEEEARERIRGVNEEHRQATHNCWAYRVGTRQITEYFSDDGEPAGTAGKPILGAIIRQDLTNAVIVVTRYFGGVKLGVRGLIEAYGGAATEGIQASGKALKRIRIPYRVEIPYDMVKSLERLLDSLDSGEQFRQAAYCATVTIQCRVPLNLRENLEEFLVEWEGGGKIFRWCQRKEG